MIEESSFREWLKQNTTYSDAVIGDMVSRVKRANKILPFYNEEVYQFYLEHTEEYKALSVSVRSQIKKAVKLYIIFLQNQ